MHFDAGHIRCDGKQVEPSPVFVAAPRPEVFGTASGWFRLNPAFAARRLTSHCAEKAAARLMGRTARIVRFAMSRDFSSTLDPSATCCRSR